ncbi:MAG: type II toxin-antitoxin system RelE/ParE family toxin [Verrucomicrobiales bacterium]
MRYIARDDQTIARRFGERIISNVEKITAFPRSGRMVQEQRNDLIREIILSPYRIIFQIDDAALRINVMKIWHSARGSLNSDQ